MIKKPEDKQEKLSNIFQNQQKQLSKMSDREQIQAAYDEVEELYGPQLVYNKPHETEEEANEEEIASDEWAKKEDEWDQKQQMENPARHLIEDEAEDNDQLLLQYDDEEASK